MSVIASPTLRLLTVAAVVSVPLLAVAPTSAAPGGQAEKVRICHRTNSVTNPYVSIEVARSAIDGDGANDRGQGDHYLNHTGPIWTPQTDRKDDWGDIIPPIPGIHDGRNWTTMGQAMWTAGCRPVAVTDTDSDGTPDIVDPDTDGDGVPDTSDADDDGDGTPDAQDPDESTTTDTDGDGVPDAVDSDDDGDGVVDDSDCEVALASGNCTPSGTVVPLGEDEVDTDGDGRPNVVDPDDDGDGIPDAKDPDQDGDGNPDVTDPDDDGDGVPDPLDDDRPPVEPSNVVDTDGDGTPDSRDRDDDGDGVPDVRDADADGDGRPEVTPQPLSGDVVLPARIEPGEPTVLLRGAPETVAGVPALATIACTPTTRAGAKAPSGDIGADRMTRMLCRVDDEGPTTRITVRGEVPTTVVVSFRAFAVGDYRALRDVRTFRVVAR